MEVSIRFASVNCALNDFQYRKLQALISSWEVCSKKPLDELQRASICLKFSNYEEPKLEVFDKNNIREMNISLKEALKLLDFLRNYNMIKQVSIKSSTNKYFFLLNIIYKSEELLRLTKKPFDTNSFLVYDLQADILYAEGQNLILESKNLSKNPDTGKFAEKLCSYIKEDFTYKYILNAKGSTIETTFVDNTNWSWY